MAAFHSWLALAACPLLIAVGQEQVVPNETPRDGDPEISHALEPILRQAKLPALIGAIVSSGGLIAVGVVGVRKVGAPVPATSRDDWHLGSDTKAMTATLVGLLIDQGSLRFESTLGEVFPELAAAWPQAIRSISVEQLLCHRSGLPHDADWRAIAKRGARMEQRKAAVEAVGTATFVNTPGIAYSYSNWGFVVLGAMAERVTGQSWEELMQAKVFRPLGMERVGFGGTGTINMIDQPWPHLNGKPAPFNGPAMDNLPVMAPAGEVHCSIAAWAKFISNELRGLEGKPNLLSPGTFKRLHTPADGGNYAGGWIIAARSWANGVTLTHSGSNTMNYAVAWLAPARDIAFLACSNAAAPKPCDQAIQALMRISGPKTAR